MSRAEAALRRIVSDLEGLSRRFALVGGLAVSARTEPRLTRDADLAVLVADDRDAESLVRDLQARRWRVVASVEQDAAGRRATVRLAPGDDTGGIVVDLLFASSGIEPEVVTAADRIDVLPRSAALDEARAALALVAQRGFHRGRDLEAALAATVAEFRD